MSKHFTPHPYQLEIIAHQCEVARGATFAGMGTGKTSSTLSTVRALQFEGFGPALVMAPLRVAQSTWPDECQKWTQFSDMEVQPIIGDEATRKAALRNKNAGVFTINYDNLPWLRETLGRGVWPFEIVVADESTRLKSFRLKQGGVRARAIGQIAHTSHVKRWINLTGTPMPNGLLDLWGQTWMLDAGERLGTSFDAFQKRWFYKDFDEVVKPHEFAMAQIQERLKDICRTVQGLPVDKPIVNDIYVDLPPRARRLYDDMEKTYFALVKADTEVEAFSAAARSQKLLQFTSGAVYPEAGSKDFVEIHDAKIQALESVIEEAAGASVLVAYHFQSSLHRLQRAFPKGRVFDADPRTLREWNAGRISPLFIHPQSAGHGLNMQDGGAILADFDLDWNLEHYEQVIERIGPMRQKQSGHNRPVFRHRIIARDTIDQDVVDRLENKGTIQSALLKAMQRRGL